MRNAWIKQTCEKAIEVGRNYETNLSSLKKLASDEDPTVNTLNFRPGIVGSVQIKTKRKTEKTAEAEEVESNTQMQTVWL